VFKIGDFSKLSQVPIKTLRYYDEIGLLHPAHVDQVTGYRFYSVDQLPRLNMVLALKDLGFKLDQVQELIDDHVTSEQVQGMLRLRRAEIEGSLAEEEARLARVEHRLDLINKEGRMPQHEVVIKKAEPTQVAAVRGIVKNYQSVGTLIEELFAEMGKNQIAPAGPVITVYYDHEYKEKDVDVEAAVPITSNDAELSGRVTVRELEGYEELASLTRVGPYDDFTPAYQELMDWVQSNGYQIIGPNREIYLRGPEANIAPEEYVTEIQFPVTKA
jgi:effector-binding domain-containing protein